MTNIEIILWFILFIDSIVYNFICWFAEEWFHSSLKPVSNIMPINKVFGALYILLASWIGICLIRLDILLPNIIKF